MVQYCLDIALFIDEVTRVLRPDAPLVITLGRTSNVLGASFLNGALIRELMDISGGFREIQVVERVFTNRFGEQIYEDIFIARKRERTRTNVDNARRVGVEALKTAFESVPERNRRALADAIDAAGAVSASRLLEISVPAAFAKTGEKKNNGSR